jgi:hypothetical protein
MSNINKELLKALHIAFPAQLWGLHGKRFIINTGAAETFYSRSEVAEELNRERAALEVKASLIQSALDLLEPEEQP